MKITLNEREKDGILNIKISIAVSIIIGFVFAIIYILAGNPPTVLLFIDCIKTIFLFFGGAFALSGILLIFTKMDERVLSSLYANCAIYYIPLITTRLVLGENSDVLARIICFVVLVDIVYHVSKKVIL